MLLIATSRCMFDADLTSVVCAARDLEVVPVLTEIFRNFIFLS